MPHLLLARPTDVSARAGEMEQEARDTEIRKLQTLLLQNQGRRALLLQLLGGLHGAEKEN